MTVAKIIEMTLSIDSHFRGITPDVFVLNNCKWSKSPLKFSDPTGQTAHRDCRPQALVLRYRLYITEVTGHCLYVHPNRFRSYRQHLVNVIYHVEYSVWYNTQTLSICMTLPENAPKPAPVSVVKFCSQTHWTMHWTYKDISSGRRQICKQSNIIATVPLI
jgi:hypothetical protein